MKSSERKDALAPAAAGDAERPDDVTLAASERPEESTSARKTHRSRIPFRYVWRGLAHRGLSSGLTLLSFAFVSGVWIILQSMISTMERSLTGTGPEHRYVILSSEATAENQSRLDRGLLHQMASLEGIRMDRSGRSMTSRELSTTTTIQMSSTPDKGQYQPRESFSSVGYSRTVKQTSVGSRNTARRETNVTGVNSERIQVNVRGVSDGEFQLAHPGWRMEVGRMFHNDGSLECVIGKGFARSSGLKIGSTLRIWEQDWLVTGIFSEQGTPFESELWADAKTIAIETGRTHTTSLWLLASPGEPAENLVQRLSEQRERDVRISEEGSYFGSKGSIGQELRFLVYFTSGILGIGAVLSGINTLYASLSSRSKELATLRAIGFESRAVRSTVLIEGLALSLSGWIVASCLSLFLNGVGFRSMVSGIGFVTFSLRIDPAMILSAGVLALGMGTFGSWLPALRSTRTPIVKALSGAAAGFLLLLSPFLAERATAQHHELRFDSALVLSLTSDPALESIRLQIEDSRLQQEYHWVNALPELTLDAELLAATQAANFPRFREDGGLELVEQGRPYDFRSTLELSSSLNDWRRGFRKMQVESITEEMLQADREKRKLALHLLLEESYHEWEHLNRQDLAYRRLLTLKDSLTLVYRHLYNQGSVSVMRPMDGELDAANAWIELSKVESRKQDVLDRVAVLTGLNPLVVTGLEKIDSEPWEGLLDSEPDEWISIALEAHPSLVHLKKELSRTEKYESLSRIQRTPEMAVFGRVNYYGPKETFGVDIPGVDEWLGQVGVRLRYGFKSSVKERIERQQWTVRQERIQTDIQKIQTEIREDLWRLARKATQDFNQTLQARMACAVESQRIELLREEISIGSSVGIDLLLAEIRKTQLWIDFQEARMSLISTILDIERTIGRRIHPKSQAFKGGLSEESFTGSEVGEWIDIEPTHWMRQYGEYGEP